MKSKKILTAIAASATLSVGISSSVVAMENQTTIQSKQAQATSLLKSYGTVIAVTTNPECTDHRKL